MGFIESLQEGTNTTHTENGALSNLSSLNPVLDYFALAGAMRRSAEAAGDLFAHAYSADKVLAVKTLFYLRDVRQGQGERAVFRVAFKKLLEIDRPVGIRLLDEIAEYGRWADLIDLYSIAPKEVVAVLDKQLKLDRKAVEEGESVSLLAKWLPSTSTSSKATRALAMDLARDLNLMKRITVEGKDKYIPRPYRVLVAKLRRRIGLLEQDMSAKRWDDIQLDKIPGQAFRKHTKAFERHIPEKYKAFTEAVVKGEKKINATTLYPHEVYNTVHSDPDAANAMWASLPDYTRGENALVLADVSASMNGTPMATSVSLALYFAERNKGAFNGYFMTFSAQPRLQKVTGDTLAMKMNSIQRSDWDMNTNVAAAFDAILMAAIRDSTPKEEMPAILYIVSDMEFDASYINGNEITNLELAKHKFKSSGYDLPHIVFWNVDARTKQAAATANNPFVTLVSGSSPSTFKHAFTGKTPYESMLEVLNGDRYKQLEKAFE